MVPLIILFILNKDQFMVTKYADLKKKVYQLTLFAN